MTNLTNIIPARDHHIADIVDILNSVWNQEIAIAQVQQVLTDKSHQTLVALDNGIVVGFIDGFPTTSAKLEKRMELDLLAVSPSYRNLGIAQSLIRTFVSNVHQDYQLIRALVAQDNVSCQKALSKCGFSSQQLVDLYILGQVKRDAFKQRMEDIDFIEVQTIQYSGLWIEGEISDYVIQANLTECATRQLDLVGSVIPSSDVLSRSLLMEADFGCVGRYHWWELQR